MAGSVICTAPLILRHTEPIYKTHLHSLYRELQAGFSAIYILSICIIFLFLVFFSFFLVEFRHEVATNPKRNKNICFSSSRQLSHRLQYEIGHKNTRKKRGRWSIRRGKCLYISNKERSFHRRQHHIISWQIVLDIPLTR